MFTIITAEVRAHDTDTQTCQQMDSLDPVLLSENFPQLSPSFLTLASLEVISRADACLFYYTFFDSHNLFRNQCLPEKIGLSLLSPSPLFLSLSPACYEPRPSSYIAHHFLSFPSHLPSLPRPPPFLPLFIFLFPLPCLSSFPSSSFLGFRDFHLHSPFPFAPLPFRVFALSPHLLPFLFLFIFLFPLPFLSFPFPFRSPLSLFSHLSLGHHPFLNPCSLSLFLVPFPPSISSPSHRPSPSTCPPAFHSPFSPLFPLPPSPSSM